MEETRQPSTTSNPPSVENAYKRKCLALKKRLNEIEEENELMRLRNRRGWQYIQKMRLESCILLERLAKVTGMTEEAQAGVNPELRARASAMMTNVAAVTGGEAGKNGAGAPQSLEDETEGSSDEQPPTPQERPLRVKRSRKSNMPNDANLEDEAANNDNNNDSNTKDKEEKKDGKDKDATESGAAADGENGNGDSSSSLPRLAPAPSQDDMTSSFRIQSGSNGSPNDKEGTTSDRGSHNPESAEQRGDGGAEDETTPMDMDTKEEEETKEEREG
ncbi:hypothetical protein AbraIFM66950_003101 [Aspergillus brasiliensis]|nr:hypothetical protein AbraIFM66950_003101 [Aspergillus brasiliensis]